MKRLGILFICVFISSFILGQSKPKMVDLLMGNELKTSAKNEMIYIIGSDDTGIYALKGIRKGKGGLYSGYIVQHFDNSMNFTNEVELDLSYQKKDRELESMFMFGDKIVVLSSFMNKKVKTNFLFLQTLNSNTLEINNDIKKVGEVDYSGKTKYNAGGFGFDISRDSTKMLVYINKPYENKDNQQYGFSVYDQDVNVVWTKDVTLPYSDKLFEIYDYIVDNNGNVHILGRLYESNLRNSKNGKPNYKYIILSYYLDDNQSKEYKITLEDNFINDMKIDFDKDKIICAGFYSESGTIGIKGSFYFTVDIESKEMSNISYKEFSLDFLTQNMNDRQARKMENKDAKGKDVELYKYDLNDLVLREDGGAILVGEQFDIQIVTSTSTGANGNVITTKTYYYIFNDIIVININPEGEIVWAQKIGKRQRTRNDFGYYSSYAMAVIKDKLYFVFNDNAKNLYYKGEGKLAVFGGIKNALAVLVVLDKDGNQTKEALFGASKKESVLRPIINTQIDNSSIVVYCTKKKLEKFVKIIGN